MDSLNLAWWRMHNLGLTSEPFDDPEAALRHLTAVQSQDYRPATWSLAHRVNGADYTSLDQLFDDGRILRTHVLRPTWHFALAEDIRLLLQVTGPRVQISCRSRYKSNGVDAALFNQCNQQIDDLLSGHNHLTRPEIRQHLLEQGIELDTAQMNCVMIDAELEGIICSGRRRGKDQTYALLDERAPDVRTLDPDEALAELTLRYFTARGPATINDFRSWGSMTISQIKRGIDLLGTELQSIEIDGLSHWYVIDPPASLPELPHATLLQRYDEYMMGYLESRGVIDLAGRYADLNPDRMSGNPLFIDSQIVGHWRRTPTTSRAKVQIEPLIDLAPPVLAAIEAEAARFGAFLGLDASVEVK
jgi:hypothetical protein